MDRRSLPPDVAALVGENRLTEAAVRAAEIGAHGAASELWEQACDLARAAAAALDASDPARALVLAAAGDVPALARQAVDALAATPDALHRVALRLEARGLVAWASEAHERTGALTAAADAAARAGNARRAADLFERSGDVRRAAAALERGLERDEARTDVRVALGHLLARHGKDEAAMRVLQRVPPGAPERGAALATLALVCERLHLLAAAEEARAELATLGTPDPATVALASASELAAAAGRRVAGRYDVLAEVASSPWARVARAQDVLRGAPVALKTFVGHDLVGAGRDAWSRFLREAHVLARLRHPHVVPILDVIPEGPTLVLGWMDGGTLERLLAGPALAPARAAEIARALLEALGAAHRVGILHRDVKPANVLFDDAGVPMLADFGVAHLDDASTTATAAVLGTRAYMSPEQKEGRPASVASDLYGIGAIFYEMLTGFRPGEANAPTPSEAHVHLDARHDALVRRLLAPAEHDRPEDAAAAVRAIDALPWPAAARTQRRPSSHPPPSRSPVARLVVRDDGTPWDAWAERSVRLLPLTPSLHERARLFSRVAHGALQAILRVDERENALWLELPAAAEPRRPRQWAPLRQALAELHRAGWVHGPIGERDIVWDEEGQPTLLFPEALPPETWVAASDDDALTMLTILGG